MIYSFYLLISVSFDSEAISDGLNPLIISHPARNISFTAIGIPVTIPNTENSVVKLNIINKVLVNNNAAPIKPQTEINRGTILD